MTSEIVYLKQKCNRLIERAQEKELLLKNERQNRDKLQERKDSLQLQLKRIEASKKQHIAETRSAIGISEVVENPAGKRLMPMLIPQRVSLMNLQSESHPTIIEQELFPRIFEQQIREQVQEKENVHWVEDIWVEQPESVDDDYYTDVNYREADVNLYRKEEERRYLGMPEETVIIYEHGGFYEFLRKLGYLLLFTLVLLLIAVAIIAVMITIFGERGYINGFNF